jgi:membrane AbrB-like protein
MGLTDVLPPAWLVALVQIVIGSIAGSRFAGVTMHELRSTAFQALAWTVIVLAAAAGMAALGAYLFDVSYPGLLLALAPAGMPEMTIISYALGVETALVVTCQIFRLMLILTLAPLAFRAFAGPQPDDRDKT